jgi:hypothetical protein
MQKRLDHGIFGYINAYLFIKTVIIGQRNAMVMNLRKIGFMTSPGIMPAVPSGVMQ